jgi:hypothetical protein
MGNKTFADEDTDSRDEEGVADSDGMSVLI